MTRRLLLLAIALAAVLVSAEPALADPATEASPAQITFGVVDLHFGGTPRQFVQISNRSPSASVALGALTIEGADSASFELVNDGCSQVILEPMTSCGAEVELHLSARGVKQAGLEVPQGLKTLEVPLSAEGVTGTLAANPDPLRFEAIPYTSGGSHEGEDNETEQVNLEDLGAGTLVGAVTISGPGAASYSIQYGDCERDRMAPGNTCDEGIRFQPIERGVQRATLTIASDGTEPALEIPLEGEGLLGPVAEINTTQALLGDVAVGSTVEQTFTVANTGDYPLYIQQDFLVSGTPLMFKVLGDSCAGTAVKPGSSCELHVDFTPTTAGQKDASILLITNATPPIKVLGLDATATDATAAIVPSVTAPPPKLRPLISFKAPQLTRAQRSTLLETGIIAVCPAGVTGCEISTKLTAGGMPASSSGRSAHTPAVLGGRRRILGQGQNARLLVRLNGHALKLLGRYGRIKVTLTAVISAGGAVLDRQSRQVWLGAATRHTSPQRAERV